VFTLRELAERLELPYHGDPERPISGLASLAAAGPLDLTFLADKKYLPELAGARAGVVILAPELRDACPCDVLLSDHPYVSFAHATQLFDNRPPVAAGIHPAAVVSTGAHLSPGVSIGPHACVEDGVVLGEDVSIGAGAYVGHNSIIGARSRIYPHVVIYHDVQLGSDCIVHSQAVLGADGFGFAPGSDGWVKICQLGGVRIGDRAEIGAGTTVDRGALEHTEIADGVIIDNQVQVAHNCRIGKNTAIAGCTGIAGSTTIGDNCTLAGAVGVSGHLAICDNVHLTGQARVTRSITRPGSYSSGTPLEPTREWGRNAVRFTQLDAITRRLAALEKLLQEKQD
jgi:UDP-3-O-[3-hydroxymyristoyl] glucosamine N-acyltransferase